MTERKGNGMEEILEILSNDARTSAKDIAKMVGTTEASVNKAIKKYEQDGIIVKYQALINRDLIEDTGSFVRALIEVSVAPQKNVGFDAIAERIYNFPEVKSCYLVSGAYDLLLVVEGSNIQTVSNFIASKLSPMDQVRSTSTHFLLKKYKENGQVLKKKGQKRRLNISY